MDSFDIPRCGGSYFPSDLVALRSHEVFIDCGAYDGDSLASFVEATTGLFDKALCFEPDQDAYRRLRLFVSTLPAPVRDRITTDERAVASRDGVAYFDGGGTPGSRVVDSGLVTVPITTVDSLAVVMRPTFIKMDIEGGEFEALAGAAATIRGLRPILAICVYHLQADLFRLPLAIREATDAYSMFLRRQGEAGDLVCFAIPNERLPDV
jgi:FkbM family methyltransferase